MTCHLDPPPPGRPCSPVSAPFNCPAGLLQRRERPLSTREAADHSVRVQRTGSLPRLQVTQLAVSGQVAAGWQHRPRHQGSEDFALFLISRVWLVTHPAIRARKDVGGGSGRGRSPSPPGTGTPVVPAGRRAQRESRWRPSGGRRTVRAQFCVNVLPAGATP